MAFEADIDSMNLEDLQNLQGSLQPKAKPKDDNSLSLPDLDSMTVAELQAYGEGLSQQQAVAQENRYTDTGEYYFDRIQSGLTATPSMVGAAWRTLIHDPFAYGPVNSWEELYTRFGENFMGFQSGYQDMFGMEVDKTGKKAPDDFSRYIGTGLEISVDPAGLLKNVSLTIGSVLGRFTGLNVLGYTSTAGGDVAGAAQEAVTGEKETGTWRTAGSILAGTGSAMLNKPVIMTATNLGGQLKNKYKKWKENPAAAQEAYSTGYVKRVMAKIVDENPNIENILNDLNKIGVKWDAGSFPLIAAAAESPTAHAQLVQLARTNTTYRHGFMEELTRIKQLVEDNADRIFGQRYAQFPWTQSQIKAGLQARQGRLITARSKIDDRIQDLQDRLDPNMTDLARGDAIKKLIKTREKLARAEVSPLYKELLDTARKNGAHVPSNVVEPFYDFVKANSIRDLFGKLTDVDKQVLKKLKPKIIKEKGVVISREFKSLSFDQIDSLKRAINQLKRQPLSKTEKRQLANFESEFNQLRKQVRHKTKIVKGKVVHDDTPPPYNKQLDDIDKIYYEKVGLPFSAEAIAQIGKKRYTSEVANIILKNREAVDQYLNVAGKEGPQLARDAMIAKLHSKAIVDGILDPKKLARELKKNKDVIDGIPGMKGEVDALLKDSRYLNMRMATLDDALKIEQKKIADHFIVQSGFSPDYKTLLSGVIENPKNIIKFLKDVKALDSSTRSSVMNTMRREFVDLLQHQPGGAYEFLINPRNAKTINSIMGKNYTKDLKDFAKVIDAMDGIDTKKLGATLQKTEIDPLSQVVPGVDIKYASSQYRDRISSITMKVTRIISKMVDFRNKKQMDKAVFELLTDVDGMKKVSEAVANMDFKIKNPADVRKIVGLISEILPVYMYSSVKTAVSHKAEEIEQKIQ